MTIVRVALNVPIDSLFDYRLPDASPQDIGRLVRVPDPAAGERINRGADRHGLHLVKLDIMARADEPGHDV